MDENLDKKIDLRERIISLFKRNKIKFYSLGLIILISLIVFIVLEENKKRKNSLISEKYVKASLLVSKNQTTKAKEYYEEIILSKNNFYALLSLNKILEKNLINDKDKILELFSKMEKKDFSEEYADLILLKKSLYLIQINQEEAGKKILNNLIKKNSNLKSTAQEILD